MTLSLSQLDISTPCAQGFEFEYIPVSTGIPSGVHLTVIGSHAEKIKEWVRKSLNQMRQREAILKKRGKDEDVRSVEEDERFSIESAAIRIISWRGITEECTFENACKLCEINPDIRAEVMRQSEEMGNFLSSKKKS